MTNLSTKSPRKAHLGAGLLAASLTVSALARSSHLQAAPPADSLSLLTLPQTERPALPLPTPAATQSASSNSTAATLPTAATTTDFLGKIKNAAVTGWDTYGAVVSFVVSNWLVVLPGIGLLLTLKGIKVDQLSFGVTDVVPLPRYGKEPQKHRFVYSTINQVEPKEVFTNWTQRVRKFYPEMAKRVLTRGFKWLTMSTRDDELTLIFFDINKKNESPLMNELRSYTAQATDEQRHLDVATRNANHRALGMFAKDMQTSGCSKEEMLETIGQINSTKLQGMSFDEMESTKLRSHIFPMTDIVHMLRDLEYWRTALNEVSSGNRPSLEKKFVRNIETAALLLATYPDYVFYIHPTLRQFPGFVENYNIAVKRAEALKRLAPLDFKGGLNLIDTILANPGSELSKISAREQKLIDKRMTGTADPIDAEKRRENRRAVHRREPLPYPGQPLTRISTRDVWMPPGVG